MVSEQKWNNYGLMSTTTVEGTNIRFSEVFKRITPNISGYYVFESEVRITSINFSHSNDILYVDWVG